MKVTAFEKVKKSLPCAFHFYFNSNTYINDPVRDAIKKDASLLGELHNYEAFYLGGKDLRIFPAALSNNGEYMVIRYTGLKPWNILYTHVSFSDFLWLMSSEGYCLYKESVNTKLYDCAGDSLLNEASEDINAISDRNLLKLISEKPYLLHESKFTEKLIDILIQARYSTDRNKREKFKSLLSKLIPKNQGGKNPLPFDIRLDLARELMIKFAEFLSKRCREIIKNELKHSDIKDLAIYDDLRQRAEDNKEFEISRIRDNSKLSLLILKPAAFVDSLIKEALKTSPKTLKRMKFRSR